jgi:NADH-quinone oxidoreductase subunit C
VSWRESVNSALTSALGVEVTYDEGFGPPTFDVPAERWIDALSALRAHGFDYFDWLTAVDELSEGFAVVCHLAALRGPGAVEHVLVRTRVAKSAASLPTATGVFAGASWHERETHEMFGVDFVGHPGLAPLLLPDEFEGHPLRKDFVLAARVAKAWPGAKEPGESDHDTGRSPSRRRVAPPGVPGPEAWGPRPPGSPTPDPTALTAPARPARPARRERGDRPARAVRATEEHATGRPATEPASTSGERPGPQAAAPRPVADESSTAEGGTAAEQGSTDDPAATPGGEQGAGPDQAGQQRAGSDAPPSPQSGQSAGEASSAEHGSEASAGESGAPKGQAGEGAGAGQESAAGRPSERGGEAPSSSPEGGGDDDG